MLTREEMQERIENAIEEFMAKHERQRKRGRKRNVVKLFSVDRNEPERKRAIMGPDETRVQ